MLLILLRKFSYDGIKSGIYEKSKYMRKNRLQLYKALNLLLIERTKKDRSRNQNEKKNADSVYAYFNY